MTTNQTKPTVRFTLRDNLAHKVAPDDPAPGAEARIAAVMPVVARMACRFHRDLAPRLQGLIGIDDLVQEAWVVLIEEDHRWNESICNYFAWAIVRARQTFLGLLGRRKIGPPPLHPDAIDQVADPFGDRDVSDTAIQMESAAIARAQVRPARRDPGGSGLLCSLRDLRNRPIADAAETPGRLAIDQRAVVCNILATAERQIRNQIIAWNSVTL